MEYWSWQTWKIECSRINHFLFLSMKEPLKIPDLGNALKVWFCFPPLPVQNGWVEGNIVRQCLRWHLRNVRSKGKIKIENGPGSVSFTPLFFYHSFTTKTSMAGFNISTPPRLALAYRSQCMQPPLPPFLTRVRTPIFNRAENRGRQAGRLGERTSGHWAHWLLLLPALSRLLSSKIHKINSKYVMWFKVVL